jgi:hypothetical protein
MLTLLLLLLLLLYCLVGALAAAQQGLTCPAAPRRLMA